MLKKQMTIAQIRTNNKNSILEGNQMEESSPLIQNSQLKLEDSKEEDLIK